MFIVYFGFLEGLIITDHLDFVCFFSRFLTCLKFFSFCFLGHACFFLLIWGVEVCTRSLVIAKKSTIFTGKSPFPLQNRVVRGSSFFLETWGFFGGHRKHGRPKNQEDLQKYYILPKKLKKVKKRFKISKNIHNKSSSWSKVS